jgi:hypothetical protein
MATYAAAPFVWIGNHSATSFGTLVAGYAGRYGLKPIPLWVFSVPPLLIWVLGALILVRRGATPRNLLFLTALSIPVMCVIPSQPDSNL